MFPVGHHQNPQASIAPNPAPIAQTRYTNNQRKTHSIWRKTRNIRHKIN